MLNVPQNTRVRGYAVQAFVIASIAILWGFGVLFGSCSAMKASAQPFSVTSRVLTDPAHDGTDAGQRTDNPLSPAPFPDDEALVTQLLQAFVAEADFDAPADHAAIGHVLIRRATQAGISLADMAHAYVSIFKASVQGYPRTRWVRGLTSACEAPPMWPSSIRWSRPACLNVVARARALLSGDLPDPCHGRAQHWGSRTGVDHARALRAHWKRVDCGKTLNAFWR